MKHCTLSLTISAMVLATTAVSSFQVSTQNSRIISASASSVTDSGAKHICAALNFKKRTRASSSAGHISMFLEGTKRGKFQSTIGNENANANDIFRKRDVTKIGNLDVPSMGIGTISWSSNSLTTLKNLELQSLVKEAYRSDAAMFDTAERYGSHLKTALGLGWGETEQLLQKLIKSEGTEVDAHAHVHTNVGNYNSKMNMNSRNKLKPVIATKFTPSPWRNSVESVVKACEDSRQRLGVDQIDLYQLHMPDIVQPLKAFGLGRNKDEIYWEGLAECYNRGLVKNVGVCNYGPTLLSKCQDTLAKYGVPLASNQIAFSLIGRHNGAQETVDKCNELGIKVLAYYPFAMGLLTGKYSKESLASLDDETLVTSTKTSLEVKDLKGYSDEIGPLMNLMVDIGKKRDKTVAQIALNYIMCKGAIPIPGARSVAQLKDNVGAMGWRLTKSEVLALEKLADEVGGFEGAGFKRTSEKFVGYGVEKWSLD